MTTHSLTSHLLHSILRGEQGTPVILLHGLFGMAENLAMVARPLAESFQVYSLDLRNHGRSFRSKNMSIQAMAEDVLAFMEANHIAQAHLLGHSLGGKVAMQVALQKPDTVRSLVVADIAPVTYGPHHNTIFKGLQSIDLSALKSRKEADGIMRECVDEQGVRSFLLKSLYRNEQGNFDWRFNVAVLEAQYDQIRRGNETENSYSGPTLFIKGENSSYIEPHHADTIKSLFPNMQLKMIQNTGHWLHAEKPVAFAALVQKFFTSN